MSSSSAQAEGHRSQTCVYVSHLQVVCQRQSR